MLKQSTTGILDVAATAGDKTSATYGQYADSGDLGAVGAAHTAAPEVHDGLSIERLIKAVDWIVDRESATPEDLGAYPDPANDARFA